MKTSEISGIYNKFLNFRKTIDEIYNDSRLSKKADFENALKQIIYFNQEIEIILLKKRIEKFDLTILRVGIEFVCQEMGIDKINNLDKDVVNFLNEKDEKFNKYCKNNKENSKWLSNLWWSNRKGYIFSLNDPHHPTKKIFEEVDGDGKSFELYVGIFDIYINLVKIFLEFNNFDKISNLNTYWNKDGATRISDILNLNTKSFTSTYDFILNWNQYNKYNDAKIFIPFYQRKYVWKERDINFLFSNVLELPENESHFIGSLYLYIGPGKNNKHIAELLDGQQRITTIELLLNAIENKRVLLDIDKKNNSSEKGRLKIIPIGDIDFTHKMTNKINKLVSNEIDSVDESPFKNSKHHYLQQTAKHKGMTNQDSINSIDIFKEEMNKWCKAKNFSLTKIEEKYYLEHFPEENNLNLSNELILKTKLIYLQKIENKILYNLKFFINLFIGNPEKEDNKIIDIFVNLNTSGVKLSISEVCFSEIFSKILVNVKDQKIKQKILIDELDLFFKNWKKTSDKDKFFKLLIHSVTKKNWILGQGKDNIINIFKNDFLSNINLNLDDENFKNKFNLEIKKIFQRTDNSEINYSNLYQYIFLYQGDYAFLNHSFWKKLTLVRDDNLTVFKNNICREILYIIISRKFLEKKYNFSENNNNIEQILELISKLSKKLKVILKEGKIFTFPLSSLKSNLISLDNFEKYNPPYKDHEINKILTQHNESHKLFVEIKLIIISIFDLSTPL